MTLVTITKESGIPLIGHIAFGIVCRGNSNLIQVRPTTICNISCPFCSTDGGPFSTTHKTHFMVEPNYLVEEIKKLIAIKGPLHINIDSVGEPTTYPHLTTLIKKLSAISEVLFISMQTNGTLLTKEKIRELEEAGLKRMNLSIHAISDELAKKLAGVNVYNIKHIKDVARWINASKIELLLAPVYLPGVNEKEMPQIIKFAKDLNCKVAIQKYEEYKYSRKQPHARSISYSSFYKQLKHWQRSFNTKLIYSARDLQVYKAPSFPLAFHKNERINAIIRSRGWLPGQMLAEARNRCITVVNCTSTIGDRINLRITETKHNIYLAELL